MSNYSSRPKINWSCIIKHYLPPLKKYPNNICILFCGKITTINSNQQRHEQHKSPATKIYVLLLERHRLMLLIPLLYNIKKPKIQLYNYKISAETVWLTSHLYRYMCIQSKNRTKSKLNEIELKWSVLSWATEVAATAAAGRRQKVVFTFLSVLLWENYLWLSHIYFCVVNLDFFSWLELHKMLHIAYKPITTIVITTPHSETTTIVKIIINNIYNIISIFFSLLCLNVYLSIQHNLYIVYTIYTLHLCSVVD